jgi:hypothetical protein
MRKLSVFGAYRETFYLKVIRALRALATGVWTSVRGIMEFMLVLIKS